MSDDEAADEVETLRAIYQDDIEIKRTPRCMTLAMQLNPKTGEDASQHFVRASLTIEAPAGYPEVAPICSLSNARGLTDAFCAELVEKLREESASLRGECCCYQLW